MRVAIFTDTYLPDINGVAKTLGRWASYLENHHIPCKVFAPNQSLSNPIPSETLVERFASVPFFLYPECRITVAHPKHIHQAINEFAPTIIHVATPFNMGLYGKQYASKTGIPLVASYHTHFDQYLEYYKLRWLETTYWRYMEWFHAPCEKIFVPSESTKTYLQERGFSNLEIWSRGIDCEKFNPLVDRANVLSQLHIDQDKFIILYVGRLAPEKDIDVLLHAFRSLPVSIADHMHLMIAGDGPLYKELKEDTESRYAEKISFLGFVEGERLQKLYAAADVFLFPSPTETFGNVVLEAMASGTPVIGANQGGVGDTITHGKTGLLCEPGDVQAFCHAVTRLYEQKDLRLQLAYAGLEYSKSQSWDYISRQLLIQYEQVIQAAHIQTQRIS